MQDFLAITLSFPTVIFTVFMCLSIFYWLMVIVGALGVDVLDVDMDAGHGAADGAAEAGAEAIAHAGHHGVTEAAESAGIFTSLLSFLRLRSVPVTVTLSVWCLFGWLFTHFSAAFLLPKVTFGPTWLTSTGIAAAAVVAAFVPTSIVVRPIGRALKVEPQTKRSDLIGKIVKITTSRVDTKFGTANADDGGAGLIIQVRCDDQNSLNRGANALIVAFDEQREAYEVTSVEDILPSEIQNKRGAP